MSLLAAMRSTLAALLGDRGMLLFFVLAVPFYSFFYPLPYATEAVRKVPFDVVDLDASSLSRRIIRDLAATPAISYLQTSPSIDAASRRMADGTIAGFLSIPENFERDTLRGTATVVTVFGTGAFPVQDKAVLASVAAVTFDVARAAGISRLQREGAPPAAILKLRNARVSYIDEPLYNKARGYGSYVVPAVSILIVQQILLIGIAGAIGTWIEDRRAPLFGSAATGLSAFAGTTLVFALFAFVALLYMIGFHFWLHDYPRGGNLVGGVAFAALLALAIAGLGTTLGCWLANRERALQFLLTTSVPVLFLSGVVFPRQAIPSALTLLADLLPTTPAMHGFLKLNQMAANWHEIRHELLHLSALVLLYGSSACGGVWLRAREQHRAAAITQY